MISTSTFNVTGFNQNGCAALCDVGEGKPSENKYTANAGEIGDSAAHEGQPQRVSDKSTTSTWIHRVTTRKVANRRPQGRSGGLDYKGVGLVNRQAPNL